MKTLEERLEAFNNARGKQFRVGQLVDTVEYVDARNKMVGGKKYGEFGIYLCELVEDQNTEENGKTEINSENKG